MRINKFLAQATGLSRRAADEAIRDQRVLVNEQPATMGLDVTSLDTITLDGQVVIPKAELKSIILHKPVGYVCSRRGQGSRTVYDLLPSELHHLKPVGRLDKDSSGLLLLTNDGTLAHELTHPRYQKEKVYQVTINKPLDPDARHHIEAGVQLDDGLSKLHLEGADTHWSVRMSEGRNRQIRRTFEAVGYTVQTLHRTQFGSFALEGLGVAKFREI